MTDSSKPDVLTTRDELYSRFVNDKWAARLKQPFVSSVIDRVEYEEGEKPYSKRIITKHYENNLHIALTIEYVMWDTSSRLRVKMLLVDGARHLCP